MLNGMFSADACHHRRFCKFITRLNRYTQSTCDYIEFFHSDAKRFQNCGDATSHIDLLNLSIGDNDVEIHINTTHSPQIIFHFYVQAIIKC